MHEEAASKLINTETSHNTPNVSKHMMRNDTTTNEIVIPATLDSANDNNAPTTTIVNTNKSEISKSK